SAHYSHPIDYTEERVEEAKKQKKSFYDFFNRVDSWRPLKGKVKRVSSEKDIRKIEFICDKFQVAMDDDFNTPRALASLFELVDLGFSFISTDKKDAFEYVESKLRIFFDILALKVPPKPKIPKEVEEKRKERDRARQNKDFKKADKIRENLKEKYNLIISDTGNATTLHFYILEGEQIEAQGQKKEK
ncbi:MAG: hypothetical protein JSW40_06485, partial [Candidatus Omnitrophota bacterium]